MFGCFSLGGPPFPPSFIPLLLPTEKQRKEERRLATREKLNYPNCAHHNLMLFSNDKQPLRTNVVVLSSFTWRVCFGCRCL
jgi:hypothetical protein